MSDSRIEALTCTTEFGNPSGHSMTVTSIWIAAFLDFYFGSLNNYQKFKGWIFNMSLTIMVTFIGLVGFSRLYNGVHSLD